MLKPPPVWNTPHISLHNFKPNLKLKSEAVDIKRGRWKVNLLEGQNSFSQSKLRLFFSFLFPGFFSLFSSARLFLWWHNDIVVIQSQFLPSFHLRSPCCISIATTDVTISADNNPKITEDDKRTWRRSVPDYRRRSAENKMIADQPKLLNKF